jgi:hypothetical protein
MNKKIMTDGIAEVGLMPESSDANYTKISRGVASESRISFRDIEDFGGDVSALL